jgi:hypothetical protein
MSTSEDVDEDVEVHEDVIIKLDTSEEGETSDSDLAATETDGAEATAGNDIIDNPLFDLSGIDVIDEVE